MGCICGKESITIENQDYQVKCRLGEGGFSLVDLVENRRTRRAYALKRISCYSEADQVKFMKEVEYMRQYSSHPNIINLEGVEIVTMNNPASSIISKILILMPYYAGGTLQDLIDSKAQIKQRELIYILQNICTGIAAMHSSKPPVAHRDIKPANILINEHGGAVLMDLGSADVAYVKVKTSQEGQRLQDDAAERCTMSYRAPELFNVQNGDEITPSVDIWSLGCLLYACIYLRGPFDDVYQKGGSIALAAVGGNVEYPDQLRYVYKLVELTKSMLNVAGDQRPDITTVLEKLDSIQHQLENRV